MVASFIVEEIGVHGKANRPAGADPMGGRTVRPPKIGKNKIFWLKKRDFSHEIPQKFTRLPPQLEKI